MSHLDRYKMKIRTWSAINISEGRNEKVLKDIEAILSPFELEHKLIEPDLSYHRSVISLVGDLDVIFEAIDQMTPIILQAVDLNVHRGSHYRMGAVDVIPFVFEKDHDKGIKRVLEWAKMYAKHTPVYFYGRLNPSRPTVGSIRKGGLESLLRRIEKGFSKPDLGGFPTLKSGVTAVGVRSPLAAFNIRVENHPSLLEMVVNMRESQKGFSGLMSAVFPVNESIVDLSFNLTNLEKTSLKDVYDYCVKALDEIDITPIESTLIGFISEDDLYKGFKDRSIETIENYFKFSHALASKIIDWRTL